MTATADLSTYFEAPDPATGEPVRPGSELGFLRRRVAYLEFRVAALEAMVDYGDVQAGLDGARARWLDSRRYLDAAMDAEQEVLAMVAGD